MHTKLIKKIFGLSRLTKRLIQVIGDTITVTLCFWLAIALRLNGILTEIKLEAWLVLVAVVPITILSFVLLGLYRAVVHHMAEKAIKYIVTGSLISAAVMFATNQYYGLGVPRSVPGIYFFLLVVAIGATRLIMRLLYLAGKDSNRLPVAVYGTGESGALLIRSLEDSRDYRASVIIDDDTELQGSTILNIPVLSLEGAKKVIEAENIRTALIALDDDRITTKQRAAKSMIALGLEVRDIPNLSDIVSGRIRISALPNIKIEELLGREAVAPSHTLMSKTVKGTSVLVTGAGGSIGSELCRQIFKLQPHSLVMLEANEYALYNIAEELAVVAEAEKYDVKLFPVLGSVTQKEVIERTIFDRNVQTIFHAAAYKHVPLVESNAVEAVRNNVLGTYVVCKAAGKFDVKNLTLISTDKAVRPTNIMGATKRLSELILQRASVEFPKSKFCAVRFGNVLGSSGSVVPKFKRQILQGGPITITHKDITRYFMTVEEAAQLVLQASAMSSRWDVYVLDMGEPVRILDLAKTMCVLHGKKIGTEHDTSSDTINIQITGLRPGEKLYEELLITGNEQPTEHKRIKREIENNNISIDFEMLIEQLLSQTNNDAIAKILASLPLDYTMDTSYHSK